MLGEHYYDTSAIKELVEALAPEFTGRVRALRHPAIEIKHARLENLPKRRERLQAVIAVERVKHKIHCVFAHEDCDAVEPAHEGLSRLIEKTFQSLDSPVYAVTPAWEIEAWWFQWPHAVHAVNSSWRIPDDYVGQSVGHMRDAKEQLQRAVVPKTLSKTEKRGFRTYQAFDSPAVAKSIRERGEAATPQAMSGSYCWFVRRVQQCQAAV